MKDLEDKAGYDRASWCEKDGRGVGNQTFKGFIEAFSVCPDHVCSALLYKFLSLPLC